MPYDLFDEVMKKVKNEHPKARHYVYAYRYLNEFEQIVENSSDDGEPKGTSGKPSLAVIAGAEIINSAVIIVRYFGGIKLGTGGLIRAYTKGAKIGLEAGNIIEKVLFRKVKIRLDYTLYGKVENYLKTNGIITIDTIYDDAVNLFVYADYDDYNSFIGIMADLTNGTVIVDDIGEEYLSLKNGVKID